MRNHKAVVVAFLQLLMLQPMACDFYMHIRVKIGSNLGSTNNKVTSTITIVHPCAPRELAQSTFSCNGACCSPIINSIDNICYTPESIIIGILKTKKICEMYNRKY